jgi:hypothetical protein
MKRKQLEDFYGGSEGDAAWREHVALAEDTWVDSPPQLALLEKLKGDKDLASVIYAKLGEDSLAWLETRVPALSGRKPISCLGTKNLVLRLRESLMRMD